MDQLHEPEFISLVIDVPLDVVRAHLRSCAGPTIWAWLLARFSTPSFRLSSTHFLATLCIYLNISHLTFLHLSQCHCYHTLNDLGIHLICCLCENDCTTTHDTLQNTIATIASKSGAHIYREVFHFFPHDTQRWVDIIITKDNFRTLMDVVIANLTHTNLVQHASTMIMHVTIVIVQDKTQSYTKRVPRNDFIPLTIETYNCFHLVSIPFWLLVYTLV
jgi:hypothetical protein